MSQHYIGRVFKFYVVNMSSGLSMIAGMAKGFLTDRQKQKLNMLDDVSELRKEFAVSQLEQDLGGSRPEVKTFFPFDLLPGPFDAGYEGPPEADAVPNAHEILSHAGSMGRLWDPKLSAKDNTKFEYGHNALRTLERCNLPVPSELRYDGGGGVDFGMATTTTAEEELVAAKPEQIVAAVTTDQVDDLLGRTFQEEPEEKPVNDNVPSKEGQPAEQNASICGSFLCCSAAQ